MALFQKKSLYELQEIWKEEYPNHLILMQVGAFYEAYEEEAVALSEIVQIKLYNRKNKRAAGFPSNALEKYINLIESSGHQVAVFHETEWVGRRKKRELRYVSPSKGKASDLASSQDFMVENLGQDKSKVEWALHHARRGWYVIPLVPGQKRPLISDWQKRASTNSLQIKSWWEENPNANIGIACEPSQLFILDLDHSKGELPPTQFKGFISGYEVFAKKCDELGLQFPPATYAVSTPSGGVHFYFNDGGYPVKQGAEINGLWRVDTRSRGGYIVAEGSEYTLPNNTSPSFYGKFHDVNEVIPLPSAFREILTPRVFDTDQVENIEDNSRIHHLKKDLKFERDFALKILEDRAQLIRIASKGSRHDTLLRHAFYLGKIIGQGVLSRSEVEELILSAAIQTGLESAEAKQTIHNGISGGIKNTW